MYGWPETFKDEKETHNVAEIALSDKMNGRNTNERIADNSHEALEFGWICVLEHYDPVMIKLVGGFCSLACRWFFVTLGNYDFVDLGDGVCEESLVSLFCLFV